ncbi:MAG: hypothetical protein WKF95_08135 [Rubrobacter sp.]
MSEGTQQEQTQEDQNLQEAQDFFAQSMGRIKGQMQSDSAQLEGMMEQLPEESQAQVQEMTESYGEFEGVMDQAAQDAGVQEAMDEAAQEARPRREYRIPSAGSPVTRKRTARKRTAASRRTARVRAPTNRGSGASKIPPQATATRRRSRTRKATRASSPASSTWRSSLPRRARRPPWSPATPRTTPGRRKEAREEKSRGSASREGAVEGLSIRSRTPSAA